MSPWSLRHVRRAISLGAFADCIRAQDMKGGGVEHGARFFSQPTCHHAPEVYGGMRESQAAKLLRDFFCAALIS